MEQIADSNKLRRPDGGGSNVRPLRALDGQRDRALRLGAAILEALGADAALAQLAEPQSKWMRASASPLPEKTIKALIADGTIAAARPGKFLLVDREQHDAWIAQHAIAAGAAADVDEESDALLARFGVTKAPATKSRRAA